MKQHKPNIVLLMCDDLGYGDTGFNGNEIIRTPCLDAMRSEGVRFTRFFAGGPVCSPTRGTCLTGRHYSRYGVTHANQGRLPVNEITLVGVCNSSGYRTGHFGKWHLGTMTTTARDSIRGGPDHREELSPPWLHGFDVCFSTEAKVPTWDPMMTPHEMGRNGYRWGEPATPFGTHYWDQDGCIVRDNLGGDDSRVIMERPCPIPYRFLESEAAMFGAPTLAMVEGRFKFLTNLSTDGDEDMLFDLDADIAETTNIAAQKSDRARDMRKKLSQFIESCRRSHEGQDYPDPYSPINEFQEITRTWK